MSQELRYDPGDFAYGTWRVLDDKNIPTPRDLARRFELCLKLGVDLVDTAEIYGVYAVEEAIGKALAFAPELKNTIRLVTKAGINIPSQQKGVGVAQYDATAENLIACADKSLTLLGVEQLELFLVHRPDWLTHPESTAIGLSRLLDSGKVKNVGVSNYTVHQFAVLDQYMDGRLATNQVEFSPIHMEPIYDGTFDQCLQNKVRPMAWSPLAGGCIFDSSSDDAVRLINKLKSLSPSYSNAPLDALIYAWLRASPAAPTIIFGSNKTERIQSGVLASEIKLSREDWFDIWEAAKGHAVP